MGKAFLDNMTNNISKVIVGKEETITFLLTAMIAGGHVLLEDVPGTGKTKLAKSLSKSMNLEFNRIQFTPDLLPTDIVGLNVYNRASEKFELHKGPVFTNILLADEINRATPRTQSGLLECMEERQVTIDGTTLKLDNPFFVIATENPIDTTGTFALPQAQMDRFMMRLSMGLPSKDQEINILKRYSMKDALGDISAVLSADDFANAVDKANEVKVSDAVYEYIASIVEATRHDNSILAPVSPRGSLALLHASKAYAYLAGRDYVIPDDVKKLAVPVLAHRIMTGANSVAAQEETMAKLVGTVTVPTEDFR